MKYLVFLLLAGCAGSEAMRAPMKPATCDVVYSEPQRGIQRCITRRQLEEMLRTSR